jgi:photosystem II stability/assembly factor-like uncharacterized protein
MNEITAFLSPNGENGTCGSGPATRMLVATVEGVVTLARTDHLSPWKHIGTSLTDRHVGSLVFEPVSGRLFAGTHENGGLWVSDDGRGDSWREVKKGLTRPHIYGMGMRNVNGKVTLFAGTQPVGLYRSDDLGESWTELPAMLKVPDMDKWTFPAPPHIAHVKCITMHPTDPNTYFVLVEQGGLFKTTNDGATFTEITSYSTPGEAAYRDLHRLLINPAKPDEMFVATGEGVYRTDNGGATWAHLIKRGDRVGYPDDLFFDPFDRSVLYTAGTMKNPGDWFRTGAADPAVLKSTDRGETWVELENGFKKPVGVAFEAMSQHVWNAPGGSRGYMLTVGSAAGHVWTSEDRGASWKQIAVQLPWISKDHHYLPFLHVDLRQKWIARRMARTGGGPPSAPRPA